MDPSAGPTGGTLPVASTIPCERLPRDGGETIAFRRRPGRSPGIVFIGGFRSDMTGVKASAVDAFCAARGHACLRFDPFAHGASSGRWADATVGRWAADLLAALDALTEGPLILVGSSMGGWLMLLAALARPARIAALLGIAAAPDATEELMWNRFSPEQRESLLRDGRITVPSEYDPAGYVLTRRLIEEGRRHLVLRTGLPVRCPVRLLHGLADRDVPWTIGRRLAECLAGTDVALTLVKNGDHRLSAPADLARLRLTLEELFGRCGSAAGQGPASS